MTGEPKRAAIVLRANAARTVVSMTTGLVSVAFLAALGQPGCVAIAIPEKIVPSVWHPEKLEYDASHHAEAIADVAADKATKNQMLDASYYCELQMERLRKRLARQARSQRAVASLGAITGITGGILAATVNADAGKTAAAVTAAVGAASAALGSLIGDPGAVLELYRRAHKYYEQSAKYAAAALVDDTSCGAGVTCLEAAGRALVACSSGHDNP